MTSWYGNFSTSLAMIPDSKVHGANMGSIRGRQDPGGPHVGPMDFASWDGSPPVTVSFPSQPANNVEFNVLMLTV